MQCWLSIRAVRGIFLAASLACMAALALPGSVWAQMVPANLRAAILLRALGYERGFASGSGPAKLLVVKGASGEGAQDGAAMVRAFGEILRATSLSRPVSIEQVVARDLAGTVQDVRQQSPQIVYLSKGSHEVAERLSNQAGLIVLCATAAQMDGCTVSVEVSGTSPRLVVNLGQANGAGLVFDPRLLRLSRVVR